MLGVSIVTVVYIAVSVVFLYLVPPARIASDDTAFAALAGEALLGRAGGICFTVIVIVSVAGSLAAVLMAFPRVYYAMARDGLFFASVAAVDPRRGTPTRVDRDPGRARLGFGPVRNFRPDPRLFHGPDHGVRGLDGRRGLRAPAPLGNSSPP